MVVLFSFKGYVAKLSKKATNEIRSSEVSFIFSEKQVTECKFTLFSSKNDGKRILFHKFTPSKT